MKENSWKKLLQKYLDGTCTEEERQVVDQYYASLDHRPDEHRLKIGREVEEEELWQKIHRRAGLTGTSQQVAEDCPFDGKRRWVLGGVAACVALAIGLFLTLYEPIVLNQGQDEIAAVTAPDLSGRWAQAIENEQVKVITSFAETKLFTLPDGSQATLYPGSQIRFPAQAATTIREVTMKGEVFFEVKKDPSRPFVVYAGGVVTKVLGTSFTIKAQPEGQAVEVAVRSGKVAVQLSENQEGRAPRRAQDKGVILTPNQKVSFLQGKQALLVGLVDKPVNLLGQEVAERLFVYRDTPLATVIASMGEAYGLEIIAPANLLDCPITANFSQEDLYTKLQLICDVLQARYWVEGTRIYLDGSGCAG
jgi:transmembrane sensor